MKNFSNYDNDDYNPFVVKDNSKLLRTSLNEIDKRSIRFRYKNTEDPINLVFNSIEETSLSTLTKDFIQESFSDLVIFISRLCK